MEDENPSSRLSRISTLWSVVQQAHAGSPDAATAAQHRLMARYCGAAYRYLLGAVRDEDTAAELFQEFALRFIRGDFRRAIPERGRFRDYVKKALIHLITDFYRARRDWPAALPADCAEQVRDSADSVDADDQFACSWREELLSRTWIALNESHPTYHAVLLLHAERPDMQSPELARHLTAQMGKPFTATYVRVTLHRARERFADLLVDEVAHSLESPTEDELVNEIKAVGLSALCASALERRRR